MKIVLINHSDTRGGASVVTYRLMEALRSLGVEADMLTVHKATDNPHVHLAAPHWRARIPFLAEHLRIFAGNGLNRSQLFTLSIASDGLPLSKHPLVKQADAVVLNWVNQGMISFSEIAKIAAMGKKILWTMHDLWNMTGICHIPGNCVSYTQHDGCASCPLLGSRAGKKDLSAKVFAKKRNLYSSSRITFVAISSWLEACARASELLRHADMVRIPNAFPIDKFDTKPKRSRRELGLPEHGKLIVMGAARLDDPVKGLPYAIEALNQVTDKDAVAIFYGNLKDTQALDGLTIPYRWLGPVDSGTLPDLFAHAHAVISTSLYENLPGTLIEGMAAGAMPVSFDRGGQRDIISSPDLGHLIPFGDTKTFAQALTQILAANHDRQLLHKAVEAKFGAKAVAQSYINAINNKIQQQ